MESGGEGDGGYVFLVNLFAKFHFLSCLWRILTHHI